MSLPAKFIETVADGAVKDCCQAVKNFNSKNASAKEFPGIDLEDKKKLWNAVSKRLAEPDTPHELKGGLLEALRILSRDKSTIEDVVEEQLVVTLLKIAGLTAPVDESDNAYLGMLESLKVIFNFIYQSPELRVMLINNGILQGLTSTIQNFKTSNLPPDCQYFVLRVMFMITALCQTKAPEVRELHGVEILNVFLEELADMTEDYDDITVDIITESMKALYNIIHNAPAKSSSENNAETSQDESSNYFLKVTRLVRMFFLHKTANEDKKYEIQSHSIDLLNAVTPDCYDELTPPSTESPYQFEDHDMTSIEVMTAFLHHRLENMENARAPAHSISPVLAILHHMAGSNRRIRKYLKKRILPPLTKSDLTERPEIGSTLRNRLCALLTSPSGITEYVANLLFVLCKESVNRMVKYTGYGNAAGLLASRGLMLGGRGSSNEYSSSSDESDTEEYKEVRHLINDVEGWLQPERPPPCEGMTDEQKEYEAMKLVQAIDQLQRRNIIQPCLISGDGKPVPIEHILQLQGRVPQPFNNQDSDSD